jgi:hypothetical protein
MKDHLAHGQRPEVPMAKKKARRAPAKARLAPAEAAPVEATPAVETTTPEIASETTVTETPSPVPKRRVGLVGAWAYIFGIVIAALAAVFVQQGLDLLTYIVLAALGIIVGLLNITEDEVLLFLVASVALVVSANGVRGVLENILFMETFLNNVIIFTAASAFIVSIKSLFKVAKSE